MVNEELGELDDLGDLGGRGGLGDPEERVVRLQRNHDPQDHVREPDHVNLKLEDHAFLRLAHLRIPGQGCPPVPLPHRLPVREGSERRHLHGFAPKAVLLLGYEEFHGHVPPSRLRLQLKIILSRISHKLTMVFVYGFIYLKVPRNRQPLPKEWQRGILYDRDPWPFGPRTRAGEDDDSRHREQVQPTGGQPCLFPSREGNDQEPGHGGLEDPARVPEEGNQGRGEG